MAVNDPNISTDLSTADDPPVHGLSLLPALRAATAGGALTRPFHEYIACEVGSTRALMTPRHKYIYSPTAGTRAKGGMPDYGASGRHPAAKSLEQVRATERSGALD